MVMMMILGCCFACLISFHVLCGSLNPAIAWRYINVLKWRQAWSFILSYFVYFAILCLWGLEPYFALLFWCILFAQFVFVGAMGFLSGAFLIFFLWCEHGMEDMLFGFMKI